MICQWTPTTVFSRGGGLVVAWSSSVFIFFFLYHKKRCRSCQTFGCQLTQLKQCCPTAFVSSYLCFHTDRLVSRHSCWKGCFGTFVFKVNGFFTRSIQAWALWSSPVNCLLHRNGPHMPNGIAWLRQILRVIYSSFALDLSQNLWKFSCSKNLEGAGRISIIKS